MPSGERRGPALDADPVDAELTEGVAQAAEAAAAKAEARAAAARARAERLRRRLAPASSAAGNPDSADDAADEAPPRQRRHRLPRRGWRPRLTTVGVGVLVIVSCASGGAAGSLGWQHHLAARYQQRTAEAAAAAREGVLALMSLDFNNAKHDVQRIIDHCTGPLRTNYQDKSATLTSDLAGSEIATTVTISDVAVQSVTGENADVLIAARTVRTAADGTNQDPWPWRVRLTLARDGGQLKMSEVEFVQ